MREPETPSNPRTLYELLTTTPTTTAAHYQMAQVQAQTPALAITLLIAQTLLGKVAVATFGMVAVAVALLAAAVAAAAGKAGRGSSGSLQAEARDPCKVLQRPGD